MFHFFQGRLFVVKAKVRELLWKENERVGTILFHVRDRVTLKPDSHQTRQFIELLNLRKRRNKVVGEVEFLECIQLLEVSRLRDFVVTQNESREVSDHGVDVRQWSNHVIPEVQVLEVVAVLWCGVVIEVEREKGEQENEGVGKMTGVVWYKNNNMTQRHYKHT